MSMQYGERLRERYRVIEDLGWGILTGVYLGMDEQTREIVAIHVIEEQQIKDFESLQTFDKRFRRAAKKLSGLKDERIVRMLDTGFEGGRGFVITEYVPARTLSEILRQRDRLSAVEALDIVQQVGKALRVTAKAKVVHGFINPKTVLIDRQGKVHLLGLDPSRIVLQNEEAHSKSREIALYISPEQADSKQNLTTRTDIYSIGVVLFEMMTGRVPYDGDSPKQIAMKHITDEIPDISLYRPDAPPVVGQLVNKCLRKEPDDRLSGPSRLISVISKIKAKTDLGPVSPARGSRTPPAESHAMPGGEMPAVSLVSTGGNVYEVPSDQRLVRIGRNDRKSGIHPDVDLSAEDPLKHISRRHAQIVFEDGAWRLVEEHGARGETWVNGSKMGAGKSIVLKDNDKIKLATIELTFRVAG